jgi:hypothetical protein
MKDSNDAQTIDWVDEANTETLVVAPTCKPKTLRSTKH